MTAPFTYHRPTTLGEAIDLVSEHGSEVRVFAGGTDLFRKLRSGALEVKHLVSLNHIRELDFIRENDDGSVAIGAAARLSDVGRHPEVRERYPALAHACSVMATNQIRNMGTVAGNIANGSPCADTACPLLVHDAGVEIRRRDGRRRVALSEFFKGPGLVDLAPEEILHSIQLPPPAPRTGSDYQRLSARSRVDMAAVSAAAFVELEPDGRIRGARIALGAVAPVPLRCPEAEDVLVGRAPGAGRMKKVAAACRDAVAPIDDVRASADYRRWVAGVLAVRAVERSLARARGEEPPGGEPPTGGSPSDAPPAGVSPSDEPSGGVS